MIRNICNDIEITILNKINSLNDLFDNNLLR